MNFPRPIKGLQKRRSNLGAMPPPLSSSNKMDFAVEPWKFDPEGRGEREPL